MEIPLDELQDYLEDIIADKFKKERKNARKILDDIYKDYKLVDDFFKELEGKIDPEKDDLVTRAVVRFVSSIRVDLDKFKEPPDLVNHSKLKEASDLLSKLFSNYNENGRKWVPKFGKEFKTETKSMDILMNRLFRNGGKLDAFMRKNYNDAKNAEDISEKIEKLQEMVDKLASERSKVDELTEQAKNFGDRVKQLENDLLALEDDPDVTEQNRLFREENRIKQEIKLELSKLKKSFKKFEKVVDSGDIDLRFITSRDIKDYLKKPFENLIQDGPDYPKFRAILDNLEGSLGDEVQLRDDKEEKTHDLIVSMRDEYVLKPLIESYLAIEKKRTDLFTKIKEKGTEDKIAGVKQEISDLITQRSHAQADLDHEKENVVGTLSKMKVAKEALEKDLTTLSKDSLTILLEI